jgi:hypothetical protein
LAPVLTRDRRRLTWTANRSAFGTVRDRARGALLKILYGGLQHRSLANIRSLGSDQIQYAKGNTHLMRVYPIDSETRSTLRPLASYGSVKNLSSSSFTGFLFSSLETLPDTIEFACCGHVTISFAHQAE